MEDDFAGKEDMQSTAAEVDIIYTWNKATPEDLTEAEMLAEVNEVYHRYGRYPTQHGYWAPGPRPQGSRAPFRGGWGGQRPFNPRYHTPRHLNTTVANQAYTFNSATPHASINYAPGTFSMGAPFSTHHQVPYRYQSNQLQTQNSQQRTNSFTENKSNMMTQTDTAVLVEQLQKLLNIYKRQNHQVNDIQVVTPQPSTTWDLKTAAELPSAQEEEQE